MYKGAFSKAMSLYMFRHAELQEELEVTFAFQNEVLGYLHLVRCGIKPRCGMKQNMEEMEGLKNEGLNCI